ncbi:DsbA family protein [Hymenobacter sp. DG01]|uniref:DsbA family protein n=1 Tax=Hymenobacter sp. DG01 TaxID=2584940 RepID=UPI00111CCB8C|nr:DsbA family protein [Hymenobacter sp. DG01]
MEQQHDLPELLYISDPLCAWCYGTSPVVQQVQQAFAGRLEVSVLCGGMITGEQVGPIGEDWPYLAGALAQVEKVTGVQFGAAFRAQGEQGSYLQNSEPPSRAIHAFRQLRQEHTAEFAHAVQQAYFRDGADLNNLATYKPLAAAYGLDPTEFRQQLTRPDTIRGTQLEFAAVGKIGVQGFPTLILRIGSQGYVLARGFAPFETLSADITEALRQAGEQ